ncbi:hypothetical protein CASFOL_035848 [Castilleja foliolosa]|uniref:CG-1 domain-containing protein n=1 Tax=Castilleja foliolosa TaxID=1961234 RepID=A0ABD3BVD0_9LAMI
MAESGSCNLGFRLGGGNGSCAGNSYSTDITQILSEAQKRWLRPAEIAEILRNYKKFHISPEAPNKPVSGSVFLFDRKILRYFRKDGHNWRKKKDGKTVKEAHEKLKVGSVDMLHCYYAHGEDDEYFQRRSYWLLEEDLSHIVFVHYFDVKGNKTNISSLRNSNTGVSNSENNSLLSTSFRGTSPSSTLSSAYEDAESEPSVGDNQQANSRFHSYPQSPLTDDGYYVQSSSCNQLSSPGGQSAPLSYASLSQARTDRDFGGNSFVSGPQSTVDLTSWQEVLGNSTSGGIAYKQEPGGSMPVQVNWQFEHVVVPSSCKYPTCLHHLIILDHSSEGRSLHSPHFNHNLIMNLPRDNGNNLFVEKSVSPNLENLSEPFYSLSDEQSQQRIPQMQLLDVEIGNTMSPNMENFRTTIGNENHSFLMKKPLINGLQKDGSLKKADSFSRWVAAELGETDELNLQSNNGISWSLMGNEYDSSMPSTLQVDTDTLNPSLSLDQLFSIIDFSPNWAYADLETKVLIIGTFLKSPHELSNCRWSIMFGQVEVAAEVLANDGVLCCRAPPHKAGRVPFYVTLSNRLACSEIREFEYRSERHHMGDIDDHGDTALIMHLYQRFETILSLEPTRRRVSSVGHVPENQNLVNKICSLMEEENHQETKLISDKDTSVPKAIAQLLLEKQLKEKFYSWLLQRVTKNDSGLTIADEGGQGVLHLAAALGFNWAFQPIIVSGVRIDFRDVNGWAALHWAAFYGREDTVAALVSLGAAPGVVTDPSEEYPLGRTPADLASFSGHKGISGFLAESSLTTQLSKLDVDDPLMVSERLAYPTIDGDVPDTLSLKDSLAAVCNATQAAARIHQIFRIQSFQRKQFVDHCGDELLIPDERALSAVAARTSGLGRSSVKTNAAAVSIQKKFRGWKKRKEFLLIRQKVVKIQAHFRGHQVRKKYKTITWSVSMLEKVILRWRRKGSGLRGYRSDVVPKEPSTPDNSLQEDDYDVLKEGRKQTEERMQKALARVKSMTQYPEARAQYRRLLTAAKDFREPKDEASGMITGSIDETLYPEEELLDIESLLDDDTFMSLTFE